MVLLAILETKHAKIETHLYSVGKNRLLARLDRALFGPIICEDSVDSDDSEIASGHLFNILVNISGKLYAKKDCSLGFWDQKIGPKISDCNQLKNKLAIIFDSIMNCESKLTPEFEQTAIIRYLESMITLLIENKNNDQLSYLEIKILLDELKYQSSGCRQALFRSQCTFVSDQQPFVSYHQPIVSDHQPIVSDQQPIVNDQQLFTSREQLFVSSEHPSNDHLPSTKMPKPTDQLNNLPGIGKVYLARLNEKNMLKYVTKR